MHDLNDLAYFAAVADHGGFAAASRALNLPKSKLSRHVAQLEQRLGVRLLHRTTRRFAITEVGDAFLRHCHAMLAEAEAAEALVQAQTIVPRGTVHVSCPPALLHYAVDDMLVRFLNAWPQVRLKVEATNRNVDVWQDGVDFALRVRPRGGLAAADEVVRPLALSPHVLVCAPALLTNAPPPQTPGDMARLPTLGLGNSPDEHHWSLSSPDGQPIALPHQPRLVADDAAALLRATLQGVGCAVLPQLMAFEHLHNGNLLRLLPDWAPAAGLVQAVYASRRGMRPAVRQLLDALASGFADLVVQGRCLAAPSSDAPQAKQPAARPRRNPHRVARKAQP
ncbi:LysR substrate-binding domain-containing protein [Ottowia sp.]|uniref:LysR substrate-binding domain-containing protein n=1 Tax=Ottowia sp. TaxID=1898956 RepID=UPI003A8375F3